MRQKPWRYGRAEVNAKTANAEAASLMNWPSIESGSWTLSIDLGIGVPGPTLKNGSGLFALESFK